MFRALLIAIIGLTLAPSFAAANMPAPMHYQFTRGQCPAPNAVDIACAFPNGDIYVPDDNRLALEHEIGHVFDFQLLTDGDRVWFAKRLDHYGEWMDAREAFADLYANCDGDLPEVSGLHEGSFTRPMPHHVYRALCGAIIRVGHRQQG